MATTLADNSCGHQSNNEATRQPWKFLVTGYRLIGLWCGTMLKTATMRQPWSSVTMRTLLEKRLRINGLAMAMSIRVSSKL
jgi:hypothetical protein